jgi:serine/threonine-protein kinase
MKQMDLLLWAVGAVLLAAVYLAAVLPRLPSKLSLLVSTLAALVLTCLAFMLAEPLRLASSIGVTALLFGHAGWLLGERSVRRNAAASEASASGANTKSGVASDLPSSLSTVPADNQRTLGRYQIERELGRGAMGAVFLGRDLKIGRLVAIKTLALSREFAGDELAEARKRFFREAETAGRLQHPDIVTIFDAGEDQGLAFIAMEYLKGDDLQSHTQPAHLLAVSAVAHVVARVADALAYAHSQGVVHRDVKPANVMIDLTANIVKVTDFGIARITDASRTRTGMVLGTPSFMSPEQMAGRRVDGRSDLYSLGVMLFQLLTGKLPHRSDSMATLMHQIANEPAPDIRSLRPGLPEELARLVAKTLEKQPESRYADGRLLAADLRAFAEQSAHVAEPKILQNISDPPDSSGFQATLKLDPHDPRHNSSL